MCDLDVNKVARFLFMTVVACAFTVLFAQASSARPINLSGTHSASQVQKDCGASGGTFNGHLNGGGYGCIADGGIVVCDKGGKCRGDCQKCGAVVKGVGGVARPPASAGTLSARGGATGTANSGVHSTTLQRGHSAGSKR